MNIGRSGYSLFLVLLTFLNLFLHFAVAYWLMNIHEELVGSYIGDLSVTIHAAMTVMLHDYAIVCAAIAVAVATIVFIKGDKVQIIERVAFWVLITSSTIFFGFFTFCLYNIKI